ncbi:cytochrome P450 [Nocardia suismassiliense]|uniref:Cytochrome P450 n=1 Tax=Nocardia suismassiliense TaxID=2077092 RepID=A0ABW6QP42_9NOCA
MTLALTDPPRHKQLRNIVAQWFTAPAVRSLDRDMHNAVRNTLMKVAELGECDFLHDVSGRLSMYVIGYMMGIPEQDHEAIFRWTNEAFEAHVSLAQHPELMTYFIDLMDQRIAEPADDLVSALVGGTIDDEPLTEEEVLLNCENLVGATENGRLSIAGGMQAFLEYPDQWQRLQEDPGLLSGAIEEILRWTSSAAHSMRSVTTPHVMHGQQLEAGDWVAVWIPSANRDESVFHEPDRFDIGRTPNRHLALGNGEHVCLGSALARSQMRILFSELLARYHIEPNGPARKVRSIAVRGPEALPIRISPR